jgi:hypothetical protein
MSNRQIAVGTLWYADEASYFKFRDICDDKAHFSGPYTQWFANAQQLIDDMLSRGQVVTKIHADADAFIAWCRVKSKRPDTQARSDYAAEKALETLGRG